MDTVGDAATFFFAAKSTRALIWGAGSEFIQLFLRPSIFSLILSAHSWVLGSGF